MCRDTEILISARVTNQDLYSLEHGLLSVLHPGSATSEPRTCHWGAALIDEAAQAIELASCIPTTVVSPPPEVLDVERPLFTIAGDHTQLGSQTASKSKQIETSLFERLLDRPFYNDHPLARHQVGRKTTTKVLTKVMPLIAQPPFLSLIRNYHSRPALLAVPNSLFYYETLLPEAPHTESLLSWEGWKGRNGQSSSAAMPGQDEAEQVGGAWYNRYETDKACSLAWSLLNSGLTQQEDIYVMSPFRSQVNILRALFRRAGLMESQHWPNGGYARS